MQNSHDYIDIAYLPVMSNFNTCLMVVLVIFISIANEFVYNHRNSSYSYDLLSC